MTQRRAGSVHGGACTADQTIITLAGARPDHNHPDGGHGFNHLLSLLSDRRRLRGNVSVTRWSREEEDREQQLVSEPDVSR